MQEKKRIHQVEGVQIVLSGETLRVQILPKQFFCYDLELSNQNMPKDVAKEFPNVEALFQWFLERDHYQIRDHLLHIKTVDEKSISLKLHHNEAQEKESFRYQLFEIKKRMSHLEEELERKEKQNTTLKMQLESLKNNEQEQFNYEEEIQRGKQIRKQESKRKAVQRKIASILSSTDGVQLKNTFSFYFDIVENRITFDTTRAGMTPCFLRKTLDTSSIWKLEVRILKCSEIINIGVCDYKASSRQYLSGSASALSFSSGNILWYPEGVTESWKKPDGGFKEGQSVLMTVDMENCQVDWEVNGQHRAHVISSLLEEPRRKIVPFFQFQKRYDSLEFYWR